MPQVIAAEIKTLVTIYKAAIAFIVGAAVFITNLYQGGTWTLSDTAALAGWVASTLGVYGAPYTKTVVKPITNSATVNTQQTTTVPVVNTSAPTTTQSQPTLVD